MADYTDLIARLEKATEGSEELDADIARALGWELDTVYEHAWWDPQKRVLHHCDPPFFQRTRSLDAALSLVPEEANCHGYDASPAGAEAYVSRNNVASGHWLLSAVAATPALALCAAALKARQAGG